MKHIITLAILLTAATVLADPVICPTCAARKIKSKVTIGPQEKITLVEASPHYDEDGKYVYGEVVKYVCNFACERGHIWKTEQIDDGAITATVLKDTDLKADETVKDGVVIKATAVVVPR